MYLEALKIGIEEKFLDLIQNDKLLFSDAFPYMDDVYFLPKPITRIESKNEGDSSVKKKVKNLSFIPISEFRSFLNGTMDLNDNPLDRFAILSTHVHAWVRTGADTEPFHVGEVFFASGNGLYIIVSCENDATKDIIEELLESLSFTGIGGKKSSGLGKFELGFGKVPKELDNLLSGNSGRYMLLSGSIPTDGELDTVLAGASYLLEKRSGFIASDSFAPEYQRKRDLYMFAAGSCFTKRFIGNVYEVSGGGGHPVYRYAKAMFVGV